MSVFVCFVAFVISWLASFHCGKWAPIPDPNGPVLYKGWYHLFYQYNPYGAAWGNIVWGHAVSRDLIHRRHLPIAMIPDHWYDINGVWTGSATILEDGQLHAVATSDNGPGVKHVVKTSLDDDKNDYYALGIYDSDAAKWMPDDPNVDVGIGLRYDYGIFYASKTFYDQEKKRRILWEWIKETDSEKADIQKGWASVQAIPRTIILDKKTGSDILQWPVEEVEKLRMSKLVFEKVEAKAGSVVTLDVGSVSQLDIIAEFEVNQEAVERINGSDTTYSCTTSGGAAQRGALGPFGLLLYADNNLTEQTPVYFYISKDTKGNFNTFFCADQPRSSEATDVDKTIYGSTVPVLKGEKLSMRILVDHSIVESFAQGGRTCIISRIYPTKAIYEGAHVFLFNNATEAEVTASLQIWQMSSAYAY